MIVRRHIKWNTWRPDLREYLAHLVDHAVARSLWKYYGYDQDDVATVLVFGSEKAAEHGMKYVDRTVKAAL